MEPLPAAVRRSVASELEGERPSFAPIANSPVVLRVGGHFQRTWRNADLLGLQRLHGNAHVARLMARPVPPPRTGQRSPQPFPETAHADRKIGVVQRQVFVGNEQFTEPNKIFSPAMNGMIRDRTVREYDDLEEFEKHAAKGSDYLGNLRDGTWVRFSQAGLNVLGEQHNKVRLDEVLKAVGSTNFIHEGFAADSPIEGPNLRETYDKAVGWKKDDFGITGRPFHWSYGAESLFPKMGEALAKLRPYFLDDKDSDNLKEKAAKSDGYAGKPFQEFLKLAWAYTADNHRDVVQKVKQGEEVLPKSLSLSKFYAGRAPEIDQFMKALRAGGFLGDARGMRRGAEVKPALAEFAEVFMEAIMERETRTFEEADEGYGETRDERRETRFRRWRDREFQKNLHEALKSGVRYAGLGREHYDKLKDLGPPPDMHWFDMMDDDLARFTTRTAELRQTAQARRG